MAGRWPSGIDWHYTVWEPTILGLPGWSFYLLLTLLYIHNQFWITFVFTTLLLVAIAKPFGYTVKGLFRIWNRLRFGRTRNIYNVKRNSRRYMAGE